MNAREEIERLKEELDRMLDEVDRLANEIDGHQQNYTCRPVRREP